MRFFARFSAVVLVTVWLSGCSFHGLQGVYRQQAKATQTLQQIERDLRAIKAELAHR